MISIITAVYNQLDMNRLFLESIRATTHSDWELIVVDNGSTDGTREFFANAGGNVRLIANDGNYSYPYCQNKALKVARGETLAFFNNDIFLSQGWDTHMAEILGHDGHEALTLCSNDRMATDSQTHSLNRRYKRVKYPMLALFGARKWVLSAMIRLTYGNWHKYCRRVWQRNGLHLREGFCGSAVMMTRRGIELLGEWDPTMQGADFDLYLRSVCRHQEHGDVKPLAVVTGVMHHHFSRLTTRVKYPPFRDAANLKLLEEKWGERTELLKRL